MIYLVEIVAAVDATGTEETFMFATEGFTTRPTDTPANTICRARLKQPANFVRDVGGGRVLLGAVKTGVGETVLINNDGALDAFSRYAVGWRSFKVYAAESLPSAYPAGWTLVVAATMKQIITRGSDVVIVLRERTDELNTPACPNKFLGTGGVDGGADLKDKAKQRAYGYCYNVPLQQIDIGAAIWQSSELGKTRFINVRDRGVTLTFSGNVRTSYADLVANAPAAGQYDSWDDGGMVRLGSPAAGKVVTADVVEYTINRASYLTDNDAYPGEMIKAVALEAGIASGDIDAGAVSAFSGVGKKYSSFSDSGSTTALAMISQIAISAGGWVGFDRLGKLRMGLVSAPSGSPVYTFHPGVITGQPQRIQSDEEGRGVPIKRVTVKYPRNYNDNNGDIAFSIPTSNWYAWLSDYPLNVSASNTIDVQHKNAGEMLVETDTGASGYAGGAVAGVSESTLLSLFGVERDWVEITTPFLLATLSLIDLFSVVEIKFPRYGWNSGKLMLVVGIRYQLSENRITWTLWG